MVWSNKIKVVDSDVRNNLQFLIILDNNVTLRDPKKHSVIPGHSTQT